LLTLQQLGVVCVSYTSITLTLRVRLPSVSYVSYYRARIAAKMLSVRQPDAKCSQHGEMPPFIDPRGEGEGEGEYK